VIQKAGAAPQQAASDGQSKSATVGGDIESKVKDVAGDIASKAKAFGKKIETGIHNAVDEFKSAAAPLIGLAELAGYRYPVKDHQEKVDNHLIRGSRLEGPSDYANLQQQGVKSIVDLTAEGTLDEKLAKGMGFNALNLKIIDNTPPTTAQMKQFLDFVTNPQNQPAYVHCEAGHGRTGVAVACYRMAVDGWSPDQAVAEASKDGLQLKSQADFIRSFGAQLAAGQIQGYPLPAA
jgi:protein-tyrosine phosphatase